MLILNIFLLVLANLKMVKNLDFDYEFDFADLLGVGERFHDRLKRQPSLTNSASKFLLEVYDDITDNKADLDHVREHLAHGMRQKRALREENFITKFDRMEIENCNNIATFASKNILKPETPVIPDIRIASDMEMGFNMHNVPLDLQLVRSTLKIYQQSSLGKYAQNTDVQTVNITLYERIIYRNKFTGALRTINSINTTTAYNGWLEFNITSTLNRWLRQKLHQPNSRNELIVGATLITNNTAYKTKSVEILASEVGLIRPDVLNATLGLQPFIIGYFEGPELMAKIQKLRFKRNVIRRKRQADVYTFHASLGSFCERFNFTMDFAEMQMDGWVIAPLKFEAYFCGGECEFPLGARVNPTNHAIVQTLMQLKKSAIPTPSCAPTQLGAILILHYINEDSVNLNTLSQSVVRECGCQ